MVSLKLLLQIHYYFYYPPNQNFNFPLLTHQTETPTTTTTPSHQPLVLQLPVQGRMRRAASCCVQEVPPFPVRRSQAPRYVPVDSLRYIVQFNTNYQRSDHKHREVGAKCELPQIPGMRDKRKERAENH